MISEKIFLYAEYQVSVPFEKIDWEPINQEMKKFDGMRSKTWLSGLNNHTVGGFYEFSSFDDSQKYIDELLIPFSKKINGNLTVKLFNGDIVAEACTDMNSPFYKENNE
ncbi:MAG: hypothetical protein HND53_12140 [Proteobacteria bacterium]|nr:hypothetical protein [Pseudomonadota bacterium]NOG61244.1 hypothetical protein [Pseudomonadota bacterium]